MASKTQSYTVDESNSADWIQMAELDISEQRIINQIVVECAHDHGTGKSNHTVECLDATSIATWGPQRPLKIRMKSVLGSSNGEQMARKFALDYFAMFSRPYALIKKAIAKAPVWDVELGEDVLLTDPRLPTLPNGVAHTAGRGNTNLRCLIWEKSDRYPSVPSSRFVCSVITLAVPCIDGAFRAGWWSPCAYADTAVSGSSATFDANEYTDSAEADDYTYFAENDYVHLYERGNAGTLITAQITNIAGAVFTFDSPHGLTAPIIMIPVTYSNAQVTATQKSRIYMSDGDHKLDKSSGDDLPFKYL